MSGVTYKTYKSNYSLPICDTTHVGVTSLYITLHTGTGQFLHGLMCVNAYVLRTDSKQTGCIL